MAFERRVGSYVQVCLLLEIVFVRSFGVESLGRIPIPVRDESCGSFLLGKSGLALYGLKKLEDVIVS